jgi:hypothetical protein
MIIDVKQGDVKAKKKLTSQQFLARPARTDPSDLGGPANIMTFRAQQ